MAKFRTESTENIEPTMQIGTTGLRESSGYITEEPISQLQGIRGVRYYQEMGDNNTYLALALHVIKTFISQNEWRFEPAVEDDEAAAEQAEFMDGVLFEDLDQTWEDLLEEILSMLQFGWSYFEVVYKIRRGLGQEDRKLRSRFDDGKFGVRKIAIRAQESLHRWVFDDDGELEGMVQLDTYGGMRAKPVFLPLSKCLLFRTRSFKDNPEGYALFRPVVKAYSRVKRIEDFEAIGIERDLTGIPIMEVPEELLATDAPADKVAMRRMFERLVTSVKRDEREGMVIPVELGKDGNPTGYKFRLATSGGSRQIDTDKIITRYNKQMLMLFLVQFVMFGMDKGGNRSLGESMTGVFAKSLNSFMDKIASVINRCLVPYLMDLNNVPQELWPRLVHEDAQDVDIAKLGKFIVDMSTARQLPNSETIKRNLLEQGGLPQPEEEDAFDAPVAVPDGEPPEPPDDPDNPPEPPDDPGENDDPEGDDDA